MTYKEKKLAVPFVDVPMWILVNKDLLAKHGVEMPSNDWTYDDFRDVAKKITDPEAGSMVLRHNRNSKCACLAQKRLLTVTQQTFII